MPADDDVRERAGNEGEDPQEEGHRHLRVLSRRAGDFICGLDGAAPVACGSPVNLRVGAGNHIFRVAATDLDSSSVQPAAATYPFKVKRKRKKRR